jgi:hypothetical protein
LSSTAITIGETTNNATVSINGTGAKTINGATVAFPGIAQSSAAQTGTLCWASSTITYDATLGCLSSLTALKQLIRPLTGALAEIRGSNPISYELKPEYDPTHAGRQIGFLAEDMEKLDPRLVGYGPDGKLRGVRYMQASALAVAGVKELDSKETDDMTVVKAVLVKQQREIDGLYVLVTILAMWCSLLTYRSFRK